MAGFEEKNRELRRKFTVSIHGQPVFKNVALRSDFHSASNHWLEN